MTPVTHSKTVTPTYSILVNSSDGFEDCWLPFFTLFARYWSGCQVPMFLNTEIKTWVFGSLPIRCTRVATDLQNHERMTWSECLKKALGQINTPIVLYMQEDYFLEYPVDNRLIGELVAKMLAVPEIKHIGLTHFGSEGAFVSTDDPRLLKIPQQAKYRISTQAGLWRVDALQSYILPWENGWMFEIFGSIRARRRTDLFLTIRRDTPYPPIVYQHTGVVKGRWSRFVEPLFKRECINVDLSLRGFHDDSESAMLRRAKLLGKIVSSPLLAIRSVVSR